MSNRICQPVNQVRLTNVAVVRMNRHGKRFEIACYRNKILNYRQGVETDLSEVLQTDRIFTNVSKGLFASSKDLKKCFPECYKNQEEVARLILEKGDNMQISDLERNATLENAAREVATMVRTKCVNPHSNRPYTLGQIREAMKEAEFVVQLPNAKAIKKQFLECVKQLQSTGVIPIERAKMELSIVLHHPQQQPPTTTTPPNQQDASPPELTQRHQQLIQRLEQEANVIMTTTTSSSSNTINNHGKINFLATPSTYRTIHEIAKDFDAGLQVVRQVVTEEGDYELDLDVERQRVQTQKEQKQQQQQLQQRQKQNNISNDNNNPEPNDNDDDSEDDDNDFNVISSLTTKMNRASIMNDNNDEDDLQNDDREEEEDPFFASGSSRNNKNTRKQNKKAQKRSKKAKRREKEDLAEKQKRLEAEQFRLEHRRTTSANTEQSSSTPSTTTTSSNATSDGTMKSCNTCGGSFTTSEYRTHFRSDWHRYNIKLKMKGHKPISEADFKSVDMDIFFDDGGGIANF